MLQTMHKARIKVKICTVGEEAVGKTSLVRRFVADKFDGEYTRTIGTLISKKTMELENPMGEPMEVDAVIWDIMGRLGFMDLLKDAYFYKANGVLAVCDITRKETLDALQAWLQGIYNAAGVLSTVILANKSDLHEQSQMREEELAEQSRVHGARYFLTSAKTGENVLPAFEFLLRSIVHRERGKVSPDTSGGDGLASSLTKP